MGTDDYLPNKTVGIYSTKMSMTLIYPSKIIRLEFIQAKGELSLGKDDENGDFYI